MTSISGHISIERLRRALRIAAGLVAANPEIDAYVMQFERIEAELASRERQSDARERARRIAAQAAHA